MGYVIAAIRSNEEKGEVAPEESLHAKDRLLQILQGAEKSAKRGFKYVPSVIRRGVALRTIQVS